MMVLIINAMLVGLAVWLNQELWHISGLGLVFSTVVIYVACRLVFGFLLMLLTGRTSPATGSAAWWWS